MVSGHEIEMTTLDSIHDTLYTVVVNRARDFDHDYEEEYQRDGTIFPEIGTWFSPVLYNKHREEVPRYLMEAILREHLLDTESDLGSRWIDVQIATDIAEARLGHDGWGGEELEEAERIRNVFFPPTWTPENMSFPESKLETEYSKAVQRAVESITENQT